MSDQIANAGGSEPAKPGSLERVVRPQEDVKYIIQEHSCNDWYDCPDTEEYEYEADAVMEATLLAGSSTAYKYRVVRRSERIIWKDRVVA